MEYAAVLPKQGDAFQLPQLVLAAMRATELQTADKPVHGVEKKLVFKSVIGKVLEAAHSLSIVSDDEAAKLNTYLCVGFDLVNNMVETFITLSKNPEFVQLEKDIKEAASKCCVSKK